MKLDIKENESSECEQCQRGRTKTCDKKSQKENAQRGEGGVQFEASENGQPGVSLKLCPDSHRLNEKVGFVFVHTVKISK